MDAVKEDMQSVEDGVTGAVEVDDLLWWPQKRAGERRRTEAAFPLFHWNIVIANKVYPFKMLAQLKTAVIIKEEVINPANWMCEATVGLTVASKCP